MITRDSFAPSARRSSARILPGLVLTITLATTGACGAPDAAREHDAPDAPSRSEATMRMARRLAEQVASVDPAENEFVNSRRAAWLRELGDAAPGASLRSLRRRVQLGLELLRAGEWDEAVRVIDDVMAAPAARTADLPEEAWRQVRRLRAAAHLRAGLERTCVTPPSPPACVFPPDVRAAEAPSAYTEALDDYRDLVEDVPQDASARWLLNLAAMGAGAYPEQVPQPYRFPRAALGPGAEIGRFEDVAARLGLDVLGLAGGVVMEDFDGDGDLDVMASSQGLLDPLRYFRNDGDGHFTERTAAAGLEGLVGGLNLVQADFDNDGYVDVLVLRGGWSRTGWPNSLLRNRGDGSFSDVTEEAGLLGSHPTQTAAWGDYDNDGRLDLYVGNETRPGFGGPAHPSHLHRNNGDGTFTEVAAAADVAVRGFIKGVAWGDYDNDGLLDLYVSRLDGPNHLFRNSGPDASGEWRFEDVAADAGVRGPVVSFPTWFFDFDNDGWLDLFVVSWGFRSDQVMAEYLGLPHGGEHSRLYRNAGDGTFEDVAGQVGLGRLLKVMGSNYGDLDNDGYPDLFVGVGEPDMQALIPTLVFRNVAGRRFQEVTRSGGFGHLGKGHGVAFGDVDNDGDQDVYMVLGGAYQGDLFRNALYLNPGHGHHWVTLRLRGDRANRSGIGARIRVTVETETGVRDVYALAGSGGSFGASSLQQEIGLGPATKVRRLEILWPGSGTRDVFEGIEMDRIYRVTEGASRPVVVDAGAVSSPRATVEKRVRQVARSP